MGRQWAGRGLRVNIDDDFQRNQIPVTILRRQVRAPPSSCRVRISGSAASRAPSLPLHTTTRLRRLDSLSAEPCTSRRPLNYAARAVR